MPITKPSVTAFLYDWDQELVEKDAKFISTGHIRQPTDWYDRQMEKEKLAIHPIDINRPESECEK